MKDCFGNPWHFLLPCKGQDCHFPCLWGNDLVLCLGLHIHVLFVCFCLLFVFFVCFLVCLFVVRWTFSQDSSTSIQLYGRSFNFLVSLSRFWNFIAGIFHFFDYVYSWLVYLFVTVVHRIFPFFFQYDSHFSVCSYIGTILIFAFKFCILLCFLRYLSVLMMYKWRL